jgi:1,4-dihydroxy-2-naphthoate octaprenyltransferase
MPANNSFSRREIFLAWWRAARPPFYVATLVPLLVALSAAAADGYSNAQVFCGALLICFLLQLCANLGNDLFDHLQGTDDAPGAIGGSRGLQEGKISVRQLARAVGASYALALVLACAGVWITGLKWLLPMVLLGMFSSFFYVAPPIRYGYRALGELFVFLNMGLVMVAGTYYALSGRLSPAVLALSLPVGMMVAVVLYFQSLPEIESDRRAGKRTLANVLGPEKAFFLFKLWWPGVWLILLVIFLSGLCSWAVLPGIALCLPLHLKACRKLDAAGGDWLSLDKYGYLTRLMYFICGLSLALAVALR